MARTRRDAEPPPETPPCTSRHPRSASVAAASATRRSGRLAASRAAPAVASRRASVKRESEAAATEQHDDAGSRRERALHQRLYLLERRTASEFVVLGNTGNAYDVTLEPLPRCSCPDWRFRGRAQRCKHILFVLLRVLAAPPHSAAADTAARRIPPDELAALLAAPARHVADASPQLLARYAALAAGESVPELPPRVIDAATDVCAICYEALVDATNAPLVHCRLGCGSSVHAACFARWAAAKRAARETLTCVYCRAPWEPPRPAKRRRGEYINLLQGGPEAAASKRRRS